MGAEVWSILEDHGKTKGPVVCIRVSSFFVHRIPCEVGFSWDLKEPILRLTSQVPDIFDLKTKGARVVDLDEGKDHLWKNNGDHDHHEPPFPLQKSNSRCHPVTHCAIGLLGHIQIGGKRRAQVQCRRSDRGVHRLRALQTTVGRE